jgi:hypothetical protein
MYRDLFQTNNCSANYAEKLHMTNEFCCKAIDTGRQLAAFFGLFYTAVLFLDIVLDSLTGSQTAPAVPHAKRSQRLKTMHGELLRRWHEHVCLFNDYTKVAAFRTTSGLDYTSKMFEVQVNMLESCSPISIELGKVMKDLDCIIRARGLYQALTPRPAVTTLFSFTHPSK